MQSMHKAAAFVVWLALGMALPALTACGAGVPVKLRIDEFTIDVDLDNAMLQVRDELVSRGVIPQETAAIPEVWPASLPELHYATVWKSDPASVDLTPDDEDSEMGKKYKKINRFKDAVERIELNRLILRVEENSLTIPLPELNLQLGPDKDTDPEQRRSWQTLGHIPPADPEEQVDLEFTWQRGGESFLNAQMADAHKEFSIRTLGRLAIDLVPGSAKPRGKAKLRLIVVGTFYVKPEGLLK